ncbi:hypothetical protein Tco_0508381 [Tanacetum coccineum]
MSKVKCYNCKKDSYILQDARRERSMTSNYYKTKMLLAKKDSAMNKCVLLRARALDGVNFRGSSSFAEDRKTIAEDLNVVENKLSKIGTKEFRTIHMIMPSKDKMYDGRKGIGFENPSYFCKAKDLRPSLYDERVIGLGYTPMFLTHSNEALEIEKFKRARENKIEFAYDYGNLNASYVMN